jgi:PhzF family phenazine biosynthesis protein
MEHQYYLLDVFTSRAFGGNQLAVFTDGAAIDGAQMAAIRARTESIGNGLHPAASRSTRQPPVTHLHAGMELPFAGHPTIGTGYLLADLGMVARTNGAGTCVFEEKSDRCRSPSRRAERRRSSCRCRRRGCPNAATPNISRRSGDLAQSRPE